MDYDNSKDVLDFADLFLDDDPFDSLFRQFELPTDDAVEGVVERIRQLQGITARSGQRKRQRYEQSSLGVSPGLTDLSAVADDTERGILDEIDGAGAAEKKKESGRKKESSDLVGKALASALAMDSPPAKKRRVKEGGSFYDCNICFELASDPVLTCCGHLFCWACFYQVGYVDSVSKECPVCKGEVSDLNVTPIYGNGGGESDCEAESELKLPPRPKARRVERFMHSD